MPNGNCITWFWRAGQADAVLEDIKTLLKPNGCLAVIEFKKIEGPPGPPTHIRLSEAEVEKMVTRHGFVKKETVDIGEYNYLMTFRWRRIATNREKGVIKKIKNHCIDGNNY